MKKLVKLIFSLGIAFLTTCDKGKSELFPNEMSEMAFFMRKMTDKLKNVKSDLATRKKSVLELKDFKQYKLTDPNFEIPGFSPMADFLLQEAKKFNQNPNWTTYRNVVTSYKSCHEISCPGPLDLINKLY